MKNEKALKLSDETWDRLRFLAGRTFGSPSVKHYAEMLIENAHSEALGLDAPHDMKGKEEMESVCWYHAVDGVEHTILKAADGQYLLQIDHAEPRPVSEGEAIEDWAAAAAPQEFGDALKAAVRNFYIQREARS